MLRRLLYPHPKRYIIGSILVAFLVPLIYFHGYNERQSVIQIIVPDKYRGEVKIIEDKQGGVNIVPVNDKWVYRIADNGMLKVNTLAPFDERHSEEAYFSKGSPLSLASKDEEDISENEIALFSGSVGTDSRDSTSTITYFVGTKKQYNKYLKDIEDHP